MSTSTTRGADHWCRGSCRSLVIGRSTSCGGAGGGGGRRTVWSRRRGPTRRPGTVRRTKAPCRDGRCTARGTPPSRRFRTDRKSVVEGKRGGLGGRRII